MYRMTPRTWITPTSLLALSLLSFTPTASAIECMVSDFSNTTDPSLSNVPDNCTVVDLQGSTIKHRVIIDHDTFGTSGLITIKNGKIDPGENQFSVIVAGPNYDIQNPSQDYDLPIRNGIADRRGHQLNRTEFKSHHCLLIKRGNLLIDNVDIKDCSFHGIRVEANITTDITFKDVDIENTGAHGYYLADHKLKDQNVLGDITIVGGSLKDIGRDGIAGSIGNSGKVVITGTDEKQYKIENVDRTATKHVLNDQLSGVNYLVRICDN